MDFRASRSHPTSPSLNIGIFYIVPRTLRPILQTHTCEQWLSLSLPHPNSLEKWPQGYYTFYNSHLPNQIRGHGNQKNVHPEWAGLFRKSGLETLGMLKTSRLFAPIMRGTDRSPFSRYVQPSAVFPAQCVLGKGLAVVSGGRRPHKKVYVWERLFL